MAEDRLAVRNVVAALGEAKDSAAALRIALDDLVFVRAVVAGEVKDLARETAEATQRVAEQMTGIQSSARTVFSGVHTTSETIGQMDAVQARMNEVLEERARMAPALAS